MVRIVYLLLSAIVVALVIGFGVVLPPEKDQDQARSSDGDQTDASPN